MFVVLGANGKVGRATVRALRDRGASVRAVVRDPARAADLIAWGCEIAVADLRDVQAIRAAIRGAAAVQVICPVNPKANDPLTEMGTTVEAISGALASHPPAATIAISDYGAERSHGTGITLIFHRLEAELQAIPTALTLLRSAEHMQNWARQTGRAVEQGILASLHHPVTKSFPTVSASDVGIASADLLMGPAGHTGQRIVHIEGPRRYSAMDVAAALGRAAGRAIVARELPRADWIPALVGGGLTPTYAQLVAETFEANNAGLIDVEPGSGDVRRGTTTLDQVFASLLVRR